MERKVNIKFKEWVLANIDGTRPWRDAVEASERVV